MRGKISLRRVKLSYKKIACLSLILAFFMAALSLSGVRAAALSFADYSDAQSHWASAVLSRAVGDNVLSGSSGKLNPNGNLTGAEMAAIMVRQMNFQYWIQGYPNVSTGKWYYRHAAIAMQAGILPADGSVAMEQPVTREQAFISFANAYGLNSMQANKESAQAGKDSTQTDKDSAQTYSEVLARFSDASIMSEAGKTAAGALIKAGVISGNANGKLNPHDKITRAEFVTILYNAKDKGLKSKTEVTEKNPSLKDIKINLSADNVSAGAPVRAKTSFSGASEPLVCSAGWCLEGDIIGGFSSSAKTISAGASSDFTYQLNYVKNMAKTRRVGFSLSYYNSAANTTENLYTEKIVSVENYSDSYFYKSMFSDALATVTPDYAGNYTSSFNKDYSTDIKKAFVYAKGYTSKTQYLVWTNLGTQKVNIFKGSPEEWTLVKTFRCASGAKSTPTPRGVTYITYKQTAWNTSKYTCRPIVRFYPNSGYAFHSILYYPNSTRVKDGTMGYPVSHGCVRMEQAGINWIYDNVPVNTTVVIY